MHPPILAARRTVCRPCAAVEGRLAGRVGPTETAVVIIRVDRSGPSLLEPEDCKRFSVEVGDLPGGPAALLAALGSWAAGGDAAHVWIRIDAVRAAAAGTVGPAWDAEFDGMVAFAGTKGWLDETGTAIRAHVA